jgi:hypothetical protein
MYPWSSVNRVLAELTRVSFCALHPGLSHSRLGPDHSISDQTEIWDDVTTMIRAVNAADSVQGTAALIRAGWGLPHRWQGTYRPARPSDALSATVRGASALCSLS